MTFATTYENAEQRGVRSYPNGVQMVDLVGNFEVDDGGPLAFMIISPPGHVLQAHFHPSDQFQIFVRGTAKLGRHEVKLGTVHYADAYTPYGPILPDGPEGYSYFTLRPIWTPLTHWIPEEIALAKGRKGRHLTADTDLEVTHGSVDLIAEDDGVGARSIIAVAGEQINIPAGKAGYYCVVLTGQATLDDQTYPPLSCIWSDGEGLQATAGPEGAALLVVRFSATRDKHPS